VLVLTGEGSKGEEAAALGIADYFCKGISMEILSSSVARMLENERDSKTGPKPAAKSGGFVDGRERSTLGGPASSAGTRRSVVIIEDDPINRKLLETYLRAHQYDVTVAEDGLTGLEIIHRSGPDCVVLDMQLPGLSGLDVMDTLQKKRFGGKIIAVTGSQH